MFPYLEILISEICLHLFFKKRAWHLFHFCGLGLISLKCESLVLLGPNIFSLLFLLYPQAP